MLREEALKAVYPRLKDQVVVTIMGAVAVELYNLGHQPNFFYLEHGMGLASSMGLGLAVSLPKEKVTVLDGDGSVLMNLGSLSTLARYRPPNLTHWIFDNESLLSVGGFPTATGTPRFSRVPPGRIGRWAFSESRSVWGIRPVIFSAGSIIGSRSKKFISCTATMLSMMVDRISLTLL